MDEKELELQVRILFYWRSKRGTFILPGFFFFYFFLRSKLVHFYPYHLSPYIIYDYFKALYFDELLFYLQDLLATEKQPQPTTRYQLKPFFEPLSNCQCLSSSKHVTSKCTCQLIGASLTNLKIFCSFLLKKLINHFFQIPLILSYCSVFTYLEWEACTSGYVASSNTTRALSGRKRIRTSSKNTILLKI